MKICAIICEYNPFHNGHLYQLSQAKRLSGADAVLCLMSGNFVQRGEDAILDKFTRAKHALLAGADAVVELPAPFACSSAEIFAKGAIKLLSSIPAVTHLCFGAEHADTEFFLRTAKLLLEESPQISQKIKDALSSGLSYAKSRAQAYGDDFPSSPNDILGVEYTKAILAADANIQILPISRIGSGYNEQRLDGNFSSATAIRNALTKNELSSAKDALPDFVYEDFSSALPSNLETLKKAAILQATPEFLKEILDCTEGLENALKKAAESPDLLVDTLTSARYTSSRIRRIALHCLLGLTKKDIEEFLQADLYLYPLGYKKSSKDLLAELSKSAYPLLTSAQALKKLGKDAKKCRDLTNFADKIYAIAHNQPYNSQVVIL